MANDVYDPLTEYVNVFRDRFKEVAENTFTELSDEAQVDVEANRETCRRLYAKEREASSVGRRVRRWRTWSVILWIATGLGAMAAVIAIVQKFDERISVSICAAVVAMATLLMAKVHPQIKKLKADYDRLSKEAEKLKAEAWEQMSPLNRLYDWDILTRMMSATVPNLEFDPYFTTQRLADLKHTYGWDDSFNAGRSVLCSTSGLINGNPFVICRTRKMEMGSKVYQGSVTIHWTTKEYGPDGKCHVVTHNQTLTAEVTAPYPYYFEKARLIYGNTAAPDLVFHRRKSGLAAKGDSSLSFKRTRRKLRKKSRDLSKSDFAMMTNEDFEVAFDTSDRNDNEQFALLFTPLAQEGMMKLLKDSETGYGDDFDFDKDKMINTVVSDHMQGITIDLRPDSYRHFDFDKAKERFLTISAEHFRAIYFNMAPLLCVPMYQQIRPLSEIYGRDMDRRSSFWEHEALANFWGQEHFKHPSCVTPCILKTEQGGGQDGDSTITVYAYGYSSQRRLTYVSRWGGDGLMHEIPVYWDEYLPVTGSGQISMKEDNDFKDESITHRQRLKHIDEVLGKSGLNLYRHHIASKL